jgi:hypothetical protein
MPGKSGYNCIKENMVGSWGSIASRNSNLKQQHPFLPGSPTSFASIMATSAPQTSNIIDLKYLPTKNGEAGTFFEEKSIRNNPGLKASYADYSDRVLPQKLTSLLSDPSESKHLIDGRTRSSDSSGNSFVPLDLSIENLILASDLPNFKNSPLASGVFDESVDKGSSITAQTGRKNKKIVIASTHCRRKM